jgi:hypothetical protein
MSDWKRFLGPTIKALVLVATLAALTVACTPATQNTATPHNAATSTDPPEPTPERPPLPPTPILEKAVELLSGEMAQEPGTYLFVERWTDITGTGECEEGILIDEPTYSYACDGPCPWRWGAGEPDRALSMLEGILFDEPDPAALIGILGSGDSISGVGGGVSAVLRPIVQLPHDASDSEASITLHSIAADGTLVAQIEDEDLLLRPGQSWIDRQYADEAWLLHWYGRASRQLLAECTVVITNRLTNFGLLPAEQIRVGLNLNS